MINRNSKTSILLDFNNRLNEPDWTGLSNTTPNYTANINGTTATVISDAAARAVAGLSITGEITKIIKGINLPSSGMSIGLNMTSSYLGYYDGASWKSYIDSAGNFKFGDGVTSPGISWNQGAGTLAIRGSLNVSDIVSGNMTASRTINAGGVTLDSGSSTNNGNIRLGQTAYNTGSGFWLGNVAGVPKFSIGNSTDNKLTWDGTNLNIFGSLSLNSSSNINGTLATTVSSAVTGYLSSNLNNSNAIQPPLLLQTTYEIDHTVNTDGSVNILFNWNWGSWDGEIITDWDESTIDGFCVLIKNHGRSAPVSQHLLSHDDYASVKYYVTPGSRSLTFNAVSADNYYTFGVYAFRYANITIAPSGTVKSAITQLAPNHPECVSGAYRPLSNIAFGGNITGTVDGTAAATISSGAIRANTALDSNGYLTLAIDGTKLTTGTLPADGLAMNSSSIGYRSSNAWTSYFDNTGKFKFYGDANNFIDWGVTTANTLTVRGKLNANDITVGGLRGINVSSGAFTTIGSYLTNAVTGTVNTLYLENTIDFASSGTGVIIDNTNDRNAFSWTGKTSTTLTGVTGVALHNVNATVIPLQKGLTLSKNTNELRFYGDNGNGTVEELVSLGINQIGASYYLGKIGSLSTINRIPLKLSSGSAASIWCESKNSAFVARFDNLDNDGTTILSTTTLGAAYGNYLWANRMQSVAKYNNTIGLYVTNYDLAQPVCTGSVAIDGFADGAGSIGVRSSGYAYDFYAVGNSGGNASYGPFTGSHDSLFLKNSTFEIGDIVADKAIRFRRNVSNTLAETELSSKEKQKNVVGVAVLIREDITYNPPAALKDLDEYSLALLDDEYNILIFNAVGEGQINVCKDGGNIEAGDYICSSNRLGKGQKQDDDLLHNYTIAKAREDCIWDDGDDSIKMIACTYHAG